MALTAYKFDCFYEDAFEKVHNLQSDTFKIALSNTAPIVATDDEFSDITEISAGNGYTAGGETVTVASSAQSGGTYTWTMSGDASWTASGGNIGPFRYYVLYNDTAANDELICYWDLGSSITLNDGDSFALNLAQILQVS